MFVQLYTRLYYTRTCSILDLVYSSDSVLK